MRPAASAASTACEIERRRQRQTLRMRTAMPPSGRRAMVTSSMKLRMKKMPRPLTQHVGGIEDGNVVGVEAGAFVEHLTTNWSGSAAPA